MSDFEDLATAMRMRTLLKGIIKEEVDYIRPPDQFGVVKSVDIYKNTAQVILDGDGIPITARFDENNRPISTLDEPDSAYENNISNRVRVTGGPGRYWITQVIRGHAAVGVTGQVSAFAGSSAPGGWKICNGAAVSRTTYAALFAVIGTTYGSGDGSTTFNLPNLISRIPVGRDAGQAEFDVLGETGGEKSHILTSGELAAHTHGLGGHTHSANTSGPSNNGSSGPSVTDTGGRSADHAHWENDAYSQNVTSDHSHAIAAWTSSSDSHNHAIGTNQSAGGFLAQPGYGGTASTVGGSTTSLARFPYTSADAHSHTIPATNTGGISANHQHYVPGKWTGGESVDHSHSLQNHWHDLANHYHSVTTGGPSTGSDSVGSNNAHNNLQPYIVMNYIIKL